MRSVNRRRINFGGTSLGGILLLLPAQPVIAQGQIALETISVEGAERARSGAGQPAQVRPREADRAGMPPPTGTVGQPPPAYPGGQVGSGTRLGIFGNRSVFDTPFNVVGYTEKLTRDQQSRSLIDVVENDPSVRTASSISDAETSTLYIRGFPLSPLDIGFDGLFGIVDCRRPPVYNIERVEVLKGPSALINGIAPNGGVGGSINLIPKRAYDEPLTRITPYFISQGQLGAAVDIGRRFGASREWGVRANGVFQKGETSVDRERLQLGFGSLGLDYRGERFRMSVDVAYQDTDYDRNRSFMVIVPGIPIPRAPRLSRNLAQPGEYQHVRSLLTATRLEFDLTDTTTVYAGFGYGRLDEDALAGYKAILSPDGLFNYTFVRQVYFSNTYTADAGVRTRFNTGPIRHNATIAASGYWYDLRFPQARQFLPAGDTNLYNPGPVPIPIFADIDIGDARVTSQINRSVAVADTMSFFDDRVLLTAGVRVQELGAKGFDFEPTSPSFGIANSAYKDTAVTPAVALVVKPLQNLSVYGNYVEALVSPGTAPAVAVNAGQTLPAIVGDQKEVGLKYDFGPFGATAAFFEINRPNAYLDPVSMRFAADGLQRNRGFEFNIFGEPLPGLRLIGGVALMDGRLVRTEGGAFNGNIAPTAPDITANLYGEYDLPPWLLPGLTATGRFIYTSKQYFDPANTQSIPNWKRFDAGLRYTFDGGWGKPVTLRANVVNVFNSNYWASTGLGLLTLGTPRTYMLSAQLDF